MKHDDDVAAMQSALEAIAVRLHGIASRSAADQIAGEVLRLNDAVRDAAHGRILFDSQPGDFAALLLSSADPCNGEAA